MPTADAVKNPFLFYYSAIKKSGDIIYINLSLVINDKVSGKMLPQQYLAVAEKSFRRIERLNNLALEQVNIDIDKNPKRVFIVYLSPKLLKFTKLNKLLKVVSQKENNVIFAVEKLLLDAMGEAGKEGISKLRERGVRILLDGIEATSIKSLASTVTDIVRIDSRLYSDTNPIMLKLIKTFCEEKGIQIVAKNVDTAQKASYLLQNGIELMEGKAIDTPKRYLKNLLG